MLWKLAWRHLWAARSRAALRWMNAVALLGLLIGVFAWTVVMSVMRGLQEEQRQRLLQNTAHLLWEGTPRRDLAPALARLREQHGAQLHSLKALLQSEALLEVAHAQQAGRTFGSGVILQGDANLARGQAVAGSELAATLGLGEGGEVDRGADLRVHSPWRLEAPPLRLRLQGTHSSGVYELDRALLRVSLADMETWLGLSAAVSRVEIQLKDPLTADDVREAFAHILGLPLKSWRELHASLWYSLRLEKLVMGLAVFFVVLLAALAVHVSMAVRVAERAREIGVLRALGAPPRRLLRLYLGEGLLLGLSGVGLGLLAGYGFCNSLARGQWLRLPDFFYSTRIPVEWSWPQNLGMAALALALALLAAYFPARRALTVEIQEALR